MTISMSGQIPEAFVSFGWSLDADRRVSDFAAIDHRPLRDPGFKRETSARATICRARISAARGRFFHTRGCDARDWLDKGAPLATPREVFEHLCELGFTNASVRWSLIDGFEIVWGCEWIWDEIILRTNLSGRPLPVFRSEFVPGTSDPKCLRRLDPES